MDSFERARQWRENLKTGDPVLIWNGWVHNPATVERTTPTQIIVRGSKYRRDRGDRIGGGSWDRIVLVEPTPDLLEEMRQKEERQALAKVVWGHFPIETVREVLKIVNAASYSGPALDAAPQK